MNIDSFKCKLTFADTNFFQIYLFEHDAQIFKLYELLKVLC